MKLLSNLCSLTLLLLLIISSLFTSSANGQANTLFDGDLSHGGFGSTVLKIGNVSGSTGVWIGGRGGWIINMNPDHSVSFGGGVYGLATSHLAGEGQNGNDLYAMNTYGGLEIEYTNLSYNLVHLTISTLIGGGGSMLREHNFHDVSNDVDGYFVMEPGIHAELNVTRYFRIGTGLAYRMTHGISRFGFSDGDFSGLNGVITFKFGEFL